MSLPLRLQFRLLPPEAQQAALRRLALSGLDPTTISAQTGMPESEVRRQVLNLHERSAPFAAMSSSADSLPFDAQIRRINRPALSHALSR